MTAEVRVLAQGFYGWRVVGGAFALAMFGWGLGFYGPPVYLHAVHEARGWPLAFISAAVTLHFLAGALVAANLPMRHRRWGLPAVTKAGALALVLGVLGWASVSAPWQLLVVALVSGAGWAITSAAAINAIVSPWFVRARPAALGMAYNGASIGGVVFSPLWVAAVPDCGGCDRAGDDHHRLGARRHGVRAHAAADAAHARWRRARYAGH